MRIVSKCWVRVVIAAALVGLVTAQADLVVGKPEAVVQEEAPPVAPKDATEDVAVASLDDLRELDFEVYVQSLETMDPASEVFVEGEVRQLWLCEDESQGFCFSDSQYARRITFEFLYDAEKDYQFEDLFLTDFDLSTQQQSVAEPEVKDYKVDPVSKSGEFTVEYNCRTAGDVKLTIELPFTVTINGEKKEVRGVSFAWVKHCPSPGGHPNLMIGYIDDDFEDSKVYFESAMSKLRVGANELSTIIFLELSGNEQTLQWFEEPVLEVSNDSLDAQLHIPQQRVVYRDAPTKMQVLYKCLGKEESVLTLRVPIKPFEDLTASWIKDCGGSSAKGLVVTYGGVSVWSHGAPQLDAQVVVPANESTLDLLISNEENGEGLHFGAMTTIADQPGVVFASAERPSFTESFTATADFIDPASYYLAGNTSAMARVQLLCKENGSSTVTVVFTPRKKEPVNLQVTKLCHMPRRKRRRFMWRTMGALFQFVLFGFLVISAFFVAMRRRDTARTAKPTKLRRNV